MAKLHWQQGVEEHRLAAMGFEALDGLSRDFTRCLFATHPEWRAFAKAERSDDGGADHLVVHVPAPEGADLARSLLIHAYRGEVTIGLDHYHTHFDWPPGQTAPPAWAEPTAFIAAILNEDLAAVSGWNGDQWAGSGLIERGQDPRAVRFRHRVTRIRVRSWRGGLDSDHEIQSA